MSHIFTFHEMYYILQNVYFLTFNDPPQKKNKNKKQKQTWILIV